MKKTIKDYDLNGKRVIIRCDLNVPMKDGIILDDTRIKGCLRTIKYAINNNAKVILLSHLGKVKTEDDKKNNSLYPVSVKLSEYLNREVIFSCDTSGDNLTNLVSNMKEKDVLLLENTRFEDLDGKKESDCDLKLSKYWASLGDIFINDAYGTCHRKHASVVGITRYLPSGIGFLVEKEINKIDGLLGSSTHPFVIILGGKKVDDKITLIENLSKKADKVLIGGAMAFTFLKALGYNTGKSIVSDEYIEFCKNIIKKYEDKLFLPKDFVLEDGSIKDINDFGNDDIGFDIGPKTVKLFEKEIISAKRVIMNGPMGLFEESKYDKGTKKILNILAKNKIKTVIGGGDTASAVNKFKLAELFYHVSTGGGATMKYLEDGKLVGIDAIDDKLTNS